MGLRDFLMGAQQFQSGTGDYANSAEQIRQQSAANDFYTQSPEMLRQYAAATTPEEKARIASQYNVSAIRSGQAKNDPYAEALAKNFVDQKTKAKDTPYKDEAGIMAQNPEINKEDASIILKNNAGDRAGMDKAIANRIAIQKELGKNTRQAATIANTNLNKTYDNAKTFGSDFNKIKKYYDDPISKAEAQLNTFLSNPNKVTAFELSERLNRSAGQVGHQSDQQIDRGTFDDFNKALTLIKNKYGNLPEGELPPEIVKAYKDLGETTLKNGRVTRAQILKDQFQTGVAANKGRLFRNGKLDPVLATTARDLNVDVSSDKNGAISVSEKPVTHVGGNTELINAANNIKDPATKAQYLQYFNQNASKQFTPDEIQHIKAKMAAGQ